MKQYEERPRADAHSSSQEIHARAKRFDEILASYPDTKDHGRLVSLLADAQLWAHERQVDFERCMELSKELHTNEGQEPALVGKNAFTYQRGKDGCDDTWDIFAPDGRHILSIPFWDEADSDAAERTEKTARMFVDRLNAQEDLLRAFETIWPSVAHERLDQAGPADIEEALKRADAAIAQKRTEKEATFAHGSAMSENEQEHHVNDRELLARIACGRIRGLVWLHHSKAEGESIRWSIGRTYKAEDGSTKLTTTFEAEDHDAIIQATQEIGQIIQEESLIRRLDQRTEAQQPRMTR